MLKQPKIITLKSKKLIGQTIEMSLTNNKNLELFSGFMPQVKNIENTLSKDVFEVMLYTENYFIQFNPTAIFTKWAAVEVSSNSTTPEGMNTLNIDSGLYAVFNYKGLPQDFGTLMRYILTDWLPNSIYQLDNRPHFNILGKKYIKDSPNSEEEVYIPLKIKQ